MRYLGLLLLVSAIMAVPSSASAGGPYARFQQRHPYHNPYLYPGRAVYAGSRYGLYGYYRPDTGLNQPVPHSMKKTAPRNFGPPPPARFIEGEVIPIHN